jgi:Mo-co oxidoreductase dimerisation domain
VPVWAIAPQSVIVAPAPGATVDASQAIEIWGWAWADGGVSQVDVRVDGGDWQPAQLEPASGRAWQRFTLSWAPVERGATTLASRATTASGECQPTSGRRNAIHRVSVNVS